MIPEDSEAPIEKFKNEVRALFLRWWHESDLDDLEMSRAVVEVTQEVCDSTIEFDSDIDLGDDEN